MAKKLLRRWLQWTKVIRGSVGRYGGHSPRTGNPRTGERGLSSLARDNFTEPNQGLDTLPGSIEHILLGPPFASLAEKDNGRTSEAESRFRVPTHERLSDVVLLDDTADGQGANFHHTQTAKVAGFEHLDAALVAKENIGLALQSVFIDGPQFGAETIRFQGHSIIHIMQVVIVDRR